MTDPLKIHANGWSEQDILNSQEAAYYQGFAAGEKSDRERISLLSFVGLCLGMLAGVLAGWWLT